MIPKILHYCWFGKGKKTDLINKCIKSWEMCCPGFEVMEWNEDNFDVEMNGFVRDAYNAKKYAYVSDYVRLLALKQCGGIYLDTDVEVLGTFDSFLNHEAFIGYEKASQLGTCVIGSKLESSFISDCLELYEGMTFNLDALVPNTITLTRMLQQKFPNSFEIVPSIIDGYLIVYPEDYFTAKSYDTGKLCVTQRTISIHHFSGSWVPWYEKFEKKMWMKIGINNRYLTSRLLSHLRRLRKFVK